MRHKVLYLCIVILVSMPGCHSANRSPYDDVNNISNVSMIIDNIDYESNQITLSIVNETDCSLTYGSEYYIEIKKNDNWYSLNTDQYFNALGYIAPPNDSIAVTIKPEKMLNAGEYRIIKPIFVEQHTYYLSSTFFVP